MPSLVTGTVMQGAQVFGLLFLVAGIVMVFAILHVVVSYSFIIYLSMYHHIF